MKTSKYFTSDRRAEYLKIKNDKEKEKEKENDNEENEEEEDEEEEDEKNKTNTQIPKSIQITRPINKDIKSNIVKREDKSRFLNQLPNSFNKQRIIYHHNQENDNSKEGSSIRRALQEKKTQPLTAASRILAKKELLRTGGNQPYTIKMSQNSPRGQLKTQNVLPPVLKTQNSQAQMQVKSRIPTKIETQSQAPLYQSKYSRRIIESSVHNDDNGKEIKIINKNNNYTINFTNNNNTINVTNNNTNNINNENNQEMNNNKDEEKEEEVHIERKEIKKESKKEPRREIRKESRKEEREINYKKDTEEKNENMDNENNKVLKNENNNNKNIVKEVSENKNDNNIEIEVIDKRKEYVTNDIMLQNGVEIVKFSLEETKRVFDKKAENEEIKKRIQEKRKRFKQSNNNKSKDYYENNTSYNFRGHFRVFYQRGRDNFSKRNINDRDNFYNKGKYDDGFNDSYDYDDKYENYNNSTFKSSTNIFSSKIGYINNNNRRFNNFYERGRPNPISRGFRGRRGRY